eukprot:scaffold12480_cov63-Phaeocystis_antarctica.AAC.2
MPWLALGARDPAGFHPLPNLARGLKPMRREHPGASRGVLSPSQTCAVLRTLRLTPPQLSTTITATLVHVCVRARARRPGDAANASAAPATSALP